LIVVNHETIRNASFSLLPIGYNPEEVDAVLHIAAERLDSGADISELATTASFDATGVGYDPAEVDAFFAELASHVTQSITDTDAEVEREVASRVDEPAEASDEPDAGEALETEVGEALEAEVGEALEAEAGEALEAEAGEQSDDVDGDHVDGEAYVQSPPAVTWQAPAAGVLDLDVLGKAVDRTADTLGSLRSFIDNEIAAMKLAVERQAQDTAKRCEKLLAEASAEARALTEAVNDEISRARKAAERQGEKQRRDLAKELKQAQADCDAEVAQARAAADEYSAQVRAAADRDRAEAQKTIENAISMQSSIAESLERARQQLTPSQGTDDQLAA
jgi:hypothetical protein